MKARPPKILLDEVFTFGVDCASWEVDDRGGKVTSVGHLCNVFFNNENPFPIRLWKEIKEQTEGKVIFEFRFRIKKRADGFRFELKNGKSRVLSMVLNGENLCLDDNGKLLPVLEVEDDIIYSYKAIVDLYEKQARISVNGKDYGFYPLADKEGKFDTVELTSPTSEPAEIHFYYVRLYRDYIVCEKFASCSPRRLPYDWKVEGALQSDAFVEYLNGYDAYDSHVLRIVDGQRAESPTIVSKSFEASSGRIVFEFKFNIANSKQKQEGVFFSLMSGEKEAVTIRTKLSGIYDGDRLLRKYNQNVWQRVRIVADLDNHEADVVVNNNKLGKMIIPEEISFVDGLQFRTRGIDWINCQVDDIKVYADSEPPKDYPSPPVKPKTKYKIGMQACFLWAEGKGPGWDKIECHPERKPYLGFYDDRVSPEKADWEIKWMAEHGISFIMPCWYSSDAYCGGPVREATLYEDYFAARYSNEIKMVLQVCRVGNIGMREFEDYLVPFWVENFFTAPNCMLINNKPVISFFAGLESNFGGPEGVREAFKIMDDACREAGFDGVFVIGNEQHRTPYQLQHTASCGFDAIYSYAWGRTCHIENVQIDIMKAQRDINAIKVIPTVCQGYNDLAWNGYTHGGYITPKHFKETLEWVRDDFLKSEITSGDIENMVLLDNWNEYGEGHFFCPAELYGFEYLDAIREVFTDNQPHEDVRPTEEQQDRLQTLYPKGRKALKVTVARPNRNGKPVKTWNFANPEDAKQWTVSKGLDNVRIEGGMLVGDITDPSGYIELNVPFEMDCKNIAYIRTKIKVSDSINMYYTYDYITKTDGEWNKEKSVSMYVTEATVEECYVETYNKKSWQDVVTGLRFHPCVSTGKFYIESIELVAYDVKPTRIYANGEERRFFIEPIVENGVVLASLNNIRDLTGVYTKWNYDDNTMFVANDKFEMTFTFGSNIALVNGKEEKLTAAPVLKDRVAYMPIEYICEKVGVKTKYVPEKKEFYFL